MYLDFAESLGRLGQAVIARRYGNLFEMYERITGEDPCKVLMRIYPAPHYVMGGLWVDYELICLDGLERDESCGGHFREEHQTEDGEAKRDDVNFCHAAVREYTGEGKKPVRNIEPLSFETLQLSQRSYK